MEIAHPFFMRFGFPEGDFVARVSSFKNVIIAQTPSLFIELKKIVNDFDTIIEIGYDRGGLTSWFYHNKKNSAEIFAFDISDKNRKVTVEEINFLVEDCFEETTVEKIKNLIKIGKKTLIFCDGGDKNQEFNLFSTFLKKDDIIMIHDFLDDTVDESYASFEESKDWIFPWQSNFSAIKESVVKNNLEKYNYDNFRKVLIGSFKKK